MGFFDFLRSPDINTGVAEYQETAGAVLLDVRTRQEYGQGHISGSKNLPLPEIGQAAHMIPKKDTPSFVDCLRVASIRQAAAQLGQIVYSNVKNFR